MSPSCPAPPPYPPRFKKDLNMDMPWYTLEIESHFTAYSVRINGITLSTDRNLPIRDERFPINQWVATGPNLLEASVWVPPAKEELPSEMDFLGKVCRYAPGVEKPEILAEIRWSKNPEAEHVDLPLLLKAVFSVATEFPAWSWADADALQEDAKPDASLLPFLESVQQAMQAKDLGAIAALCGHKALEMAAAFGIPPQVRLKDQREFFAGLFANPSYAMKPFPAHALLIQRHAQGALVEVSDALGEPAISTIPIEGGASFGLELFVCRKHGQWRICR
jgi:hypothetical protein